MKEYREKLEERVRELLGDTQMEEARIASEVVLYADKICTDEETVRLRSHIESMQRELQEGCSIGRKLDFIAQEMNREANTILSKANDLETSNIAINLKTEIEKSQRTDSKYRIAAGAGMARLVNIGFGNAVNADKVVAVVSPEAAAHQASGAACKGDRERY